jgi:hypothetical protein
MTKATNQTKDTLQLKENKKCLYTEKIAMAKKKLQ